MLAALITLLPIIIPYGTAAVAQLIAMFSKGTPTDADWQNLAMLTTTTARQQMLAVLKEHNIAPDSAQGVALLSLVP